MKAGTPLAPGHGGGHEAEKQQNAVRARIIQGLEEDVRVGQGQQGGGQDGGHKGERRLLAGGHLCDYVGR